MLLMLFIRTWGWSDGRNPTVDYWRSATGCYCGGQLGPKPRTSLYCKEDTLTRHPSSLLGPAPTSANVALEVRGWSFLPRSGVLSSFRDRNKELASYLLVHSLYNLLSSLDLRHPKDRSPNHSSLQASPGNSTSLASLLQPSFLPDKYRVSSTVHPLVDPYLKS